MRVAAYIRVSTDEQADKGNSLPEQKERLEAYCKAMGWNHPTFFPDEGQSAKDMRRPYVQKLIDRVKQKEFDIVLTSKLDRMSRNLLDMLQFVKLLDEYDCHYVSATESFDTSTAVGRMVLQLLATFAEFERERNSERVKDNMLSLARNTNKALTRPCFGLDIYNGMYEINDNESQFVLLMADLAEAGDGYRMIAKKLNERGSCTKAGKPWDQTNIKRVLRNPVIAGNTIYNMRENKNGKTVIRDKEQWIVKENTHPAIIPPERQQRILAILDSRIPANKHADSETYLLTGLVKCGHCGRNMRGNTARYKRPNNKNYDYFRYICSGYAIGYECKHHAVHREDLESLIISEVNKLIESKSDTLDLQITAPRSNASEIDEIKSQLAKVDKRIQKQIEAYENELISAQDLKAASERTEKDRNELLRRLEQGDRRKVSAEELQKSVRALYVDISGADRVRAKNALRQIINRIELLNGEIVNVVWQTHV
ncbi:recombinase family protein [Cohnella panacarvi]|uniref:recombinase family protein n=1 Tax=Cohnella panacarvi TaxID=400776 RepID=UPI00047DB301|nr:recombinase family protein [Cohnella panacarvi]